MASTIRRAASQKGAADALISRSDILFAAALPVMMALAWLTPHSVKPPLSRLIATSVARLRPGPAAAAAKTYAAPFGIADGRDFFIAAQSEFQLERLNLFALNSPIRRLPETRLIGAEHLSAALAAGRGAVLWVAATSHSRTETKLALFREGFLAHHLSRSFHGFSRTRFGKALLNPLRTRIEERFLASRVVIRDGEVKEALAELDRLLKANEIVSITMGTEAKRLAHAPFLAGRISLATRPVLLAQETGAALLPVVTTRGADGIFTTEIGAALTLPKDPTCDQQAFKALEELAGFLEPHVLAYPAQFARAEIFGTGKDA